jgi:hypothetical protein
MRGIAGLCSLLVLLVFASSAPAANAPGLLRKLETKPEVTSPSYDRDKFNHWTTTDGCTTRQRVLRRQNQRKPKPPCTAKKGKWYSAYDGLTFLAASKLDIDHVIALAEAWGSGAHAWDDDQREAFANDFDYRRSLIAVSASSNRSKSDQDPAEWMPPRAAYRCAYITNWIAVKYRWSLSVDEVERRALRRAIRRCPAKSLNLPLPPVA